MPILRQKPNKYLRNFFRCVQTNNANVGSLNQTTCSFHLWIGTGMCDRGRLVYGKLPQHYSISTYREGDGFALSQSLVPFPTSLSVQARQVPLHGIDPSFLLRRRICKVVWLRIVIGQRLRIRIVPTNIKDKYGVHGESMASACTTSYESRTSISRQLSDENWVLMVGIGFPSRK